MLTTELKQLLREQRDGMVQSHATRLHRAVSWMLSSDQHPEDDDLGFITLWIAFNACYGIESDDKDLSDRKSFRQFITRLVELDEDREIFTLLWHNYSDFVHAIVNNEFLFTQFWRSHRMGDTEWTKRFEQSKRLSTNALSNQDVATLLTVVLDRLYVLRSQLMQGGATHGSKVNRDQVQSGRALLSELMPLIVLMMMKHHEHDWGDILYPVV